MKLIIGLGNPGQQYAKTRHNAGFMALDAFVKAQGLSQTAWKEHHKAKALVAVVKNEIMDCLLVKPQTYMNESGAAAQALAAFYKISPTDIIVTHDELDIGFGSVRLSVGASAGGHKGVASIIERVGSKDFTRVRIGIGSKHRGTIPTDAFVLQSFSLFERLKLNGIIGHAAEAMECLASHTAQACMNRFN